MERAEVRKLVTEAVRGCLDQWVETGFLGMTHEEFIILVGILLELLDDKLSLPDLGGNGNATPCGSATFLQAWCTPSEAQVFPAPLRPHQNAGAQRGAALRRELVQAVSAGPSGHWHAFRERRRHTGPRLHPSPLDKPALLAVLRAAGQLPRNNAGHRHDPKNGLDSAPHNEPKSHLSKPEEGRRPGKPASPFPNPPGPDPDRG